MKSIQDRQPYSILLFDADHTLFDFEHASRHAFKDLMHHLGLEHVERAYEIYHPINQMAWRRFELGEINTAELRVLRFHDFFESIGVREDALESNAFYLKQIVQHTKLYDTTLDLLEQLKPDYKMLIITNGLKEVQRARITKLGLDHFFEHIIVSDEIGHTKPAIAYFDHVFHKINYPDKDEVLVIGDSLRSDIQGGYNYGIDTCWYNPESLKNTTSLCPKYTVKTHQEIADILSVG